MFLVNKSIKETHTLSSDTSSDEDTLQSTDDLWLSSSSATDCSVDRYSINSIPWAEDAIKQNQEEWERIERIFYGEEELPRNKKIAQEIMEWQKKFPHLRINGKQCVPIKQYSDDSSELPLNKQIEKCLRITSGPLLTRRTSSQFNFKDFFRKTSQTSEASSRLGSVKSDAFVNRWIAQQDQSEKYATIPEHSAARRGRRFLGKPNQLPKMPPIYRVGAQQTGVVSAKSSSIKSARKQLVSLPAIEGSQRFQSEIVGRSISAYNRNKL